MAGELNLAFSLRFSKGGINIARSLSSSIDVAGNVGYHTNQLIGFAAEEAVTFPTDMAAVGFVVLHNLDATNFIQVGRTAGVYTAKMLPGEFCMFRLLSGTEFFAKSDTGICDMEKILIEL